MTTRSRGQALIWLAVSLPLLLSSAGLAVDGGFLLAARRQLQSVADGAARAGATRLDVARLRASGGTDIELNQAQAMDAARAYVDEALGVDGTARLMPIAPVARVEVGARRVHVLIDGTLTTAFLRIVHIDRVPVQASAFADVQFGIRDGSGG